MSGFLNTGPAGPPGNTGASGNAGIYGPGGSDYVLSGDEVLSGHLYCNSLDLNGHILTCFDGTKLYWIFCKGTINLNGGTISWNGGGGGGGWAATGGLGVEPFIYPYFGYSPLGIGGNGGDGGSGVGGGGPGQGGTNPLVELVPVPIDYFGICRGLARGGGGGQGSDDGINAGANGGKGGGDGVIICDTITGTGIITSTGNNGLNASIGDTGGGGGGGGGSFALMCRVKTAIITYNFAGGSGGSGFGLGSSGINGFAGDKRELITG